MIRIISEEEAPTVLGRSVDRVGEAMGISAPIVADVRLRGDEALKEYRQRFDLVALDEPLYLDAGGELEADLQQAVGQASRNIRSFAEAQLVTSWMSEFSDGRSLGQLVRPLNSVGVYVPAGRYPLISTLLMAVIPAQVAGVPNIVVACPHPSREILAVAKMLGVKQILHAGGAQAIAAMAYGTESVKPVQRIVGPGNAYVAAAKKLVSQDVAIDFVAGPSEILIVASQGNAQWIAADMLAQAEHDVDARAILLTTDKEFALRVQAEIEIQLSSLSTVQIAQRAIIDNSAIVVCDTTDSAFNLVNTIAPEHLSVEQKSDIERVNSAGSIFVGQYSTEAAGDYASGPNHILPTSGNAAVRGGLSVNDFVKVITVQELSKTALSELEPAVTALARAEGLEAHARSMETRNDATA
jgi:histidinol dehydrogenase